MKATLTLLALSFLTATAFAKTYIDDSGTSAADPSTTSNHRHIVKKAIAEDDEDSASSSGKSVTYFKEAETGLEMRKIRRVGLGLQGLGALGVGGLDLELNFTPQWSFGAGYGGGGGFQAFKLEGKYVLAGDWLMPYLNFGYANWTSSGDNGRMDSTTPGILGDRFLTNNERATGHFQKNIIYPAIGLQFMQLKGEWAGASLFAEINILLDLETFDAAPTGTLGVLYYF